MSTRSDLKTSKSQSIQQLLLLSCLFILGTLSIAHAEQEELTNLDEAMEFVFNSQQVPNVSQVKLKEIHATYTDAMKVWKFTLIDGANTHVATVDKLKRFKLETARDETAYNEVFWEDRPRAEGMFKKDWLDEAETLIQSYKYELTKPTILSFKVCNPPQGDAQSPHLNGCEEDTFKETWSIVRGVEDRKLPKMVVYGDGQLESFSNVTVEISGE